MITIVQKGTRKDKVETARLEQYFKDALRRDFRKQIIRISLCDTYLVDQLGICLSLSPSIVKEKTWTHSGDCFADDVTRGFSIFAASTVDTYMAAPTESFWLEPLMLSRKDEMRSSKPGHLTSNSLTIVVPKKRVLSRR
mmetsp:Transcript_27563/g.60394  ORF Transcript_27563/g.60394 Transcript_27563/m.60394 type:complete len:139 (-) Transcript_27563:540-956(-)